MSICLITGSSGLVGSAAALHFSELGFDIVGIDNNRREFFFGKGASTDPCLNDLKSRIKSFQHYNVDIRDIDSLRGIFKKYNSSISLVIHCAAQPSHDWATSNIGEDFTINAIGTYNLLECFKTYSPDAVFIQLSTNKVYGDNPNKYNYQKIEKRFSPLDVTLRDSGFNELLSIDHCIHSFFGVSKVAADLAVQEYGLNFGLKTTILRGGCLTGSRHAGTEAHGFLSHLVKSLRNNSSYKIIGHNGYQVRDNIHTDDLCHAFECILNNPTHGSVFNIGGGISSNCSVLEAIDIVQSINNVEYDITVEHKERVGDHIWYVSDLAKFKNTYNWNITKDINWIINDIYYNG
jgi:CDP-paratose 2-epimerase